jgi:cystathionine gamma-synthase
MVRRLGKLWTATSREDENDQQLASTERNSISSHICEQKHAVGNERAMLFPKQRIAEQCRSFIEQRSTSKGAPVNARLLHLFICPENKPSDGSNSVIARDSVDLHIVLFPADSYSVAKEFWQHTGQGISSRLAEKCLSLWPDDGQLVQRSSPVSSRFPSRGHNRHYSAVKIPSSPTSVPSSPVIEDLSIDHSVYLEERYGRNLPIAAATFAKRILRSRVAGVLKDNSSGCQSEPYREQKDFLWGQAREVLLKWLSMMFISIQQVCLPSGMPTIWRWLFVHLQKAFVLVLILRYVPSFEHSLTCLFADRFPYTDTLKILQKWGPGCHFLGLGVDTDIDQARNSFKRRI